MYGDKSLKKTAIFVTIKKFRAGKNTEDQRYINLKKTKIISYQIAAVAANIKEDLCVGIKKIALAHGLYVHNIQNIFCKELGLIIKPARWVP